MKSEIFNEADISYNNGEFKKALNLYLDDLVANGVSSELYLQIANCNKYLGEIENAAEYYEKSLELNDKNYDALFNPKNPQIFLSIKKS